MATQDSPQGISKSYQQGLIFKCSLIFIGGIVLTSLIFYFSTLHSFGSSYGESFKLLTQLRQELLIKSALLYSAASLLIIAGIILITLLYSHRISGPIYRLGLFARRISAGDLSEQVFLRGKDEVQLLAVQLNTVISRYRDIITELRQKQKDLADICNKAGEKQGEALVDARRELAGKVKELEDLVENIKL
jgi:methyl-accepting chemotaxis protein